MIACSAGRNIGHPTTYYLHHSWPFPASTSVPFVSNKVDASWRTRWLDNFGGDFNGSIAYRFVSYAIVAIVECSFGSIVSYSNLSLVGRL